ncbi:MAG TPA: sensor histidine kinase [Clostridia bacterium]|nr:sensor histidine kinase [Clostridia bacterium]
MDNWMIGTRMVILLYCILRYVRGDMRDIPLVVIMILAYISTCMVSYIFKNSLAKKASRLFSVAILIFSAVSVNILFILLVSVDIIELVSYYTENNKLILFFTALPTFFCNSGLLAEYAGYGLLSWFIYTVSKRHYDSLVLLKKANEELRDRNEILLSRLDAGSEYEAQLRYLSQIEERNSLAQKIHDKVGHTLAGSIIQLEAAGLIIDKDTGKASQMVENVAENLKEGMESIRSTLRQIKPAPEQLGVNRIKLILEEFTLNSGIKTNFSYQGSLEVVLHIQWKIILDNIREALTNALKYSTATRIDIRLEVLSKLIKVEVHDNGKGAISIKKGLGLAGMEERTENAGGKLILDGSNGFSVITLLPSAAGEAAAADLNRD